MSSLILCFLMMQADALERLRAEERRYDLGASTAGDVAARRREWIRARRAAATSPEQVRALFEEEIQLATQQLSGQQRRYHLGASTDSDLDAQRRELIAVRRSFAEWAGAEKEARSLLAEEIAVVDRLLRIEERRYDLGASSKEAVSKRRDELTALRKSLESRTQ